MKDKVILNNNSYEISPVEPNPKAQAKPFLPMPSAQGPAKENLTERLISNWTLLNHDKTKSSTKRVESKLTSIYDYVRYTASQNGYEAADVEEVLSKLKQEFTNPRSLLSALRLRSYFPELNEGLLALETSEQIDSQLKVIRFS